MTEQEKIEQAAKEYATTGSFKDWLKLPENRSLGFTESNFSKTQRCFKAGASYYEKECMPGELAKAMEWISLKGLYQEIDGKWYDKFGGKVRLVAETTPELLKLFEKYKQKDNANEANKT